MKKVITILFLLTTMFAFACKVGNKKDNGPAGDTTNQHAQGAPPATWQEHWFEHNQLLNRVYYNDDLALYYDNDMDKSITWTRGAYTKIWKYIKTTYGSFGDSSRLYVVLHANKYGGGHPSPYYDASHDYRNVLDAGLGLNDWYTEDGDKLKLPIHEIGHIVASSSHGRRHDLQDDNIWGDSKFAEIFVYDVLINTGYPDEGQRVYQQMLTQDTNAPYPGMTMPGVNFFIDWFFPIYTKYGQGAVLSRYFEQIAKNVPMDRSNDLNLGEFVHFFSGAAGANLSGQAKIAFGKYWDAAAIEQFKSAQQTFPNVKYPY
jgi:hypothetical protein